MISLLKIINEATLEKDFNKNKIAKQIINNTIDIINNYSGDTKQIKKLPDGKSLRLKTDGVEITIFSPGMLSNIIKGKLGFGDKQISASYLPTEGKIFVFKDSNGHFQIEDLYHEIIHYLDDLSSEDKKAFIQVAQNTQNKINKTDDYEKGFEIYANSPLEYNAHFFQYVMPVVDSIVNQKRELPSNFDDFRDTIFSNPDLDEYYHELSKDNMKRFLKRVYVYYSTLIDLQKDAIKLDKFKNEPPLRNIGITKTKTFRDKVKSLLARLKF